MVDYSAKYDISKSVIVMIDDKTVWVWLMVLVADDKDDVRMSMMIDGDCDG